MKIVFPCWLIWIAPASPTVVGAGIAAHRHNARRKEHQRNARGKNH